MDYELTDPSISYEVTTEDGLEYPNVTNYKIDHGVLSFIDASGRWHAMSGQWHIQHITSK